MARGKHQSPPKCTEKQQHPTKSSTSSNHPPKNREQQQQQQQQQQHQQQNISKLLAASQQKRPSITSPGDQDSPNSKRRKLDKFGTDEAASPLPKMASVENMYDFGSPRKNGLDGTNGTIDLTNSPSPRARRVSNVGYMNGSTAQAGPKKLVVKNLRMTKSDPSKFIEQTKSHLNAALDAIFRNQRPAVSNEELYRGVENMCKLGKAEDVNTMLRTACATHVSAELERPLQEAVDAKAVDMLRAVVAAWRRWMKQVMTIRSIFLFLDRSYLLQNSKRSIYDMAVSLFRSHIFEEKKSSSGHNPNKSALRSKIIDGAYELLQAERTDQALDSTLFKESVDMLHDLGVYTTDLEPLIFAASQRYIVSWSETEIEARSLSEYVDASTHLIDSEMERCKNFNLDKTTKMELLTLLEHHLIERREQDLISEKAVGELLDDNSTDDLKHLYSLLQRRRLGLQLRLPFAAWIDRVGTGIVFDEKDQDQMVRKLLELKQKLDHTWRYAFHKDDKIAATLRESFEAFINKSKKTEATWNTDNSKPGEMIAKYVDQLLRAGAKAIPVNLTTSVTKSSSAAVGLGKPEAVTPAPIATVTPKEEDDEDEGLDEDTEVNNQLDQVLDLFRFVHGKAVFEAFYKKDLARRLLMGRSASNDAERSMLARLKTECGSGFTQNLEQMFKDQELAREEMSSYKTRMEQQERKLDVDINVNILSASAWPTYPDIPCMIPAEIKRAIDHFEQHYYSKHTGRKLAWKHALAHCQMKAAFPKGNKELVVSSFQAMVMLLFNGIGPDEHVTYERIKAESGLTDVEAKRTLQSLACAKLRPLTKHPRGRDINDTDTFTLNTSFTHPKYRVKINAIQLKETAAENKETHERVAADRQYETQAAIVRIMKSQKVIGHQALIAETITATKSRGVLQPGEIKRQIDRLIDKEYMEREEGNKYSYLA
ncbi:MAG: hypothetical protein M1828_007614 [Chrysothrix sp. TS-e1954]|nr:MAG: hypothetical protein M1828_007614 [Chrysothrix sp. TS-e1954]